MSGRAPDIPLDLSIVVLAYEMRDQAMRTAAALAPGRQLGTEGIAYEVVVVDNGSRREPLDAAAIEALGPGMRLVVIGDADPSPVSAVNAAVASTASPFIGVILDGACLPTPGVVATAMLAQRLGPRVFATAFAWHLGPDVQQRSMVDGYDPAEERELLARVGWPADGSALFREAAIDASNPEGWFGPISESRFFVVPRDLWDEVGGYDERFIAPGGGLAALDFFRRATTAPAVRVVGLLGEGTFHQVHGGITTNPGADRWDELQAEYERIVGAPWTMPDLPVTYLGEVAGAAREWVGAARVGDDMAREMRARAAAMAREMRARAAAVPVQGARLVDAAPGFHADGWVATSAGVTLRPSRACGTIEVVGWLPGDDPAPARIEVDGAVIADGPVGPGVFVLRASAMLEADRDVPLTVTIDRPIGDSMRAPDDDRDLAWQVGVLRLIPAFVPESP